MRLTEKLRLNPLSFGERSARACLMLLTLALVGCSAQHYENAASSETKWILFGKAALVPNVDPDFDIREVEFASLEDLPENSAAAEYLGKVAEMETGAKVIDLDTALEMAIEHNRTYLTQKETIYLEALDLTLIRHELAPIFSGEVDIARVSDSSDAARSQTVTITEQVETNPVTVEATSAAANSVADGTPALDRTEATVAQNRQFETVTRDVERQVDQLVAESTVVRRQAVGVNWLLRTGARVSADLTSDFTRLMLGDRSVNSSALVVSAAQPLLKNAGSLATTENLTQAERNLLYTLRDFANFRRSFIVDIVTQYYRVLQARDAVSNNWISYQGFLKTVEREKGLADEGRRTITEIGQLEQALLQAESSWINSVLDYEDQLDNFKIELGLAVDKPYVLKEEEIQTLTIEDPKISRDEAMRVALVTRPDLITVQDRVSDANRRIKVAKIDLRPGLDIVGDYSVLSDPGDITPDLRADRRRWSAGVELDLPFDRKAERNFYRSTLIALEQAKRDELLAVDQVKLQIFQAMRDLEQAKRNFEISELGVKVASKRLEEQNLLFEIGDGEARDLIDAQIDLINARNQRTSTIVGHSLARLRLWRDMGVLYVKPDGSWETRLASEGAP